LAVLIEHVAFFTRRLLNILVGLPVAVIVFAVTDFCAWIDSLLADRLLPNRAYPLALRACADLIINVACLAFARTSWCAKTISARHPATAVIPGFTSLPGVLTLRAHCLSASKIKTPVVSTAICLGFAVVLTTRLAAGSIHPPALGTVAAWMQVIALLTERAAGLAEPVVTSRLTRTVRVDFAARQAGSVAFFRPDTLRPWFADPAGRLFSRTRKSVIAASSEVNWIGAHVVQATTRRGPAEQAAGALV